MWVDSFKCLSEIGEKNTVEVGSEHRDRSWESEPLFHFFSPRPVVVKLRMRSPLPGTQMFHSDVTIIINHIFRSN